MRKLNLLLALFALPVLFMACGGGEEPAENTNDTDEEVIEVVIENGLESWDIEEIWVDPSDEPWSENRLEDILEPGDEFVLELDEEGEYDIQIIDEDGDTYTLWMVDIDEDGYEWEVTLDDLDWATEDVTITVENDLGSWDIYYLYGCPSESDDWGEDRLGSEILAPGERATFTVASGDWYDFLAEDEDGDTYVLLDQYIDGDFTWDVDFEYMDNDFRLDAESSTGSAPVTIYNDLGDWTIWYAYCDRSSDPWGEDRLGSELLQPGEEITFYVDPGEYDLKVEDEDGDTYTLWGVDIDSNGYYWAVTLSDMD